MLPNDSLKERRTSKWVTIGTIVGVCLAVSLIAVSSSDRNNLNVGTRGAIASDNYGQQPPSCPGISASVVARYKEALVTCNKKSPKYDRPSCMEALNNVYSFPVRAKYRLSSESSYPNKHRVFSSAKDIFVGIYIKYMFSDKMIRAKTIKCAGSKFFATYDMKETFLESDRWQRTLAVLRITAVRVGHEYKIKSYEWKEVAGKKKQCSAVAASINQRFAVMDVECGKYSGHRGYRSRRSCVLALRNLFTFPLRVSLKWEDKNSKKLVSNANEFLPWVLNGKRFEYTPSVTLKATKSRCVGNIFTGKFVSREDAGYNGEALEPVVEHFLVRARKSKHGNQYKIFEFSDRAEDDDSH